MELKSYQRAFLRSHAQALDPVVSVGKDGASESVIKALDDALTAHELVKVRFHSFKEDLIKSNPSLRWRRGISLLTKI